jgi:hypothetical protein
MGHDPTGDVFGVRRDFRARIERVVSAMLAVVQTIVEQKERLLNIHAPMNNSGKRNITGSRVHR